MFDRSVYIIDSSGIVDILAPAPPSSQRGRRGNLRPNTRIYLVGIVLCARLGHETTTIKIHQTLIQGLPRQLQLELGVIRPLTTAKPNLPSDYDPEQPRLTNNGKSRKEIWLDEGYERIGYDDLANVVTAIRKRLDYGHGTQPDLDDPERIIRRALVEEAVDALITVTTTPRTSSTVAIDGTGIRAWRRGPSAGRAAAEKNLKNGIDKHPSEDDAPTLEVAAIGIDEHGNTTPSDHLGTPGDAKGRSDDAEWGYTTSKDGRRETGYGYHSTLSSGPPTPTGPRTPNRFWSRASSTCRLTRTSSRPRCGSSTGPPGARTSPASSATSFTPTCAPTGGPFPLPNAESSRCSLCAPTRPASWTSTERSCSSAGCTARPPPMDQRPLPATFARDESDDHYDAVATFQDSWPFLRKEAGLGKNPSTKWICPAMAGKAACMARGPERVRANQLLENPLPVITPPEDWASRKCCTNRTLDFTPNPAMPHHQRTLMQREYYGSRRWRHAFNLRSLVEGAFGILKNPSRLRIRRGHNRVPGLAMTNLVNGLKVARFNEEQLRAWYERQLANPHGVDVAYLADHPLLQPDVYHWGVASLSKSDAKAMDHEYLFGTNLPGRVVPSQLPEDDIAA